MDSGKISTRYAKAIYTFAVDKGEETGLYREMNTLIESFGSFRSMNKVLKDPTVSAEDKIKVLATAAGVSISESCQSLLKLLAQNKRETYILPIALMYREYYRKQKGIIVARLTTSHPASEDLELKLKSALMPGSHKEVDFITRTDESLIGGFILRVEDLQLDASVKTQLYRLKNQLIKD